jgi:uncharacterized protein (DUF1800 family)
MTLTSSLAAIRFGYGLPVAAGLDAEMMLQNLAGPDQGATDYPWLDPTVVFDAYRAGQAARRAARGNPAGRDAFKAALRVIYDQANLGLKAGIARAVAAPDPLRERLVQFWANHFTTEAKNRVEAALPVALIEHAIRPHVTGRFADMLLAVTTHPAMLLYLDQARSVGPESRLGQRREQGLNENFARELLELHTLGVNGTYSQDDVRQAAELLTGLALDPETGFGFDPRMAEPGAETVLGQMYDGVDMVPITALLGDLAIHPDTARHLARKLVVHFVTDTPDEAMVEAMAQAYLAGDGVLLPLYGALLTHPGAAAPTLTKARQPYDFIVAALRALAVPPDKIIDMGRKNLGRDVTQPMRSMGQEWGKPGGPDGWEEAASAWINPQGMAARIRWAMARPEGFGRLPEARQLLADVLGDHASERLIWAVNAAEDQREGVGLIFASPEFNRR